MDSPVLMVEPQTLSDFIKDEIKRSGLSQRAFADKVGVTHATIDKWVNETGKDPGNPRMDFLIQLAKATNTNVVVLLALAYPEIKDGVSALSKLNPNSIRRYQIIEQMPQEARDIIDTIIARYGHSGEDSDDDV